MYKQKMKVNSLYQHIGGEETSPSVLPKRKTNRTYINIGLFVKMVNNVNVFGEKLKQELKNEFVDINPDLLDKSVKKIVYNRAYEHLSKVNLSRKSQLNIVRKFKMDILRNVLDRVIKFYEIEEDFDKCHFLFTFKKEIRDIK